MECDKNSNVLEFDFKMGQFLKDFFITRLSGLAVESKYINYIDVQLGSESESKYFTFREYKPPILEINYPNGNFEDEYKYIYIQCPKITNLLQNCFTNRVIGTNTYNRYYESNSDNFVTPAFYISDTNETINNNENIFNSNGNLTSSLLNKFSYIDSGNMPWTKCQIITPPLNQLIQKMNISTNKNYYIPYSVRNKNKLYLQLDLNNNDFALLLNSVVKNGESQFIFNDSQTNTKDLYNQPYIISNFQYIKNSSTEFYIWHNRQNIQINIGEFLDIPIQIFISKEAL